MTEQDKEQERRRPPHPPRFIGDCKLAKEAGIYEFLLHLTQGFHRFEDRWCQDCLLEAGVWWEHKDLTVQLASEQLEAIKAKACAEIDRRRERSRKSREERQAWREFREETAPVRPRPTPHPPAYTPVVNTGPGNATGSAGQQYKEKKKKETQPQEEPSFLETTGKLIVGFGRWVATGKFQ